MRATLIQHTAVDSPGIVTSLLSQRGVQIDLIRLDRGDAVPVDVNSDVLISFGGPISLHDTPAPDWVTQERDLMRQYFDQGQRVLGICLGCQLLATALGAETFANAEAELGWHPVHKTEASSQWPVLDPLPDTVTVLQWHQNTFSLPQGAIHLMQSDACDHQAFVVDDRALGLQFHPETTARTIEYFTRVSALCKKPGRFIQSVPQVLSGIEVHLNRQNLFLCDLMSNWLFETVDRSPQH